MPLAVRIADNSRARRPLAASKTPATYSMLRRYPTAPQAVGAEGGLGSKGAIWAEGAEDDEGAEGAEGFEGAEEDEGFEGAEEDEGAAIYILLDG